MLIPWSEEEIFVKAEAQKSVMGSKPGEGGSCILETKHDRIAALRPKMFRRDCRDNGHNPEKTPGFESRRRWLMYLGN
jgi:hypothetical protein